MATVFLGKFVHSKSFEDLQAVIDGFIAISNGTIIGVGNRSEYIKWKETIKLNINETQLTDSQFLIPGFIDCHIHAPQMPNIGLGLDRPLLEWLETYTYPIETEYKDINFAKSVYKQVILTTLRRGTTCAAYFATNHKVGSIVLAEEAIKQGQRAFVGKVSSDCRQPCDYVETYKESVSENIDFIKQVLALNSDLVKPIITPRFAITCSEQLMRSLAKIASNYDLNIQSHISENVDEIKFVTELFGKKYAQVYDDMGLLTPKCIMAHAVHLDEEELTILHRTGTSVAHCPSSNTALKSGLCDVRRLKDAGIKVGLGTDVSGGFYASIHSIIKSTMEVSENIGCVLKYGINGSCETKPTEYVPLTYKEVIYLATLGGAEALVINDKVGNFVVGKDFDALLVDTDVFPIDNFEIPAAMKSKKTDLDMFFEQIQKFIYVGDDRNIVNVFVKGTIVICK